MFLFEAGVMSTQLNDRINEELIEANAVIQLLKYTCNLVQGTRYGCLSTFIFRLMDNFPAKDCFSLNLINISLCLICIFG